MNNEKMSSRLDYDLDNVEERMSLVNQIIEGNDDRIVDYYDEHYNPHINQNGFLSESTKMSKDLEAMANYILHAKDSDIGDEIINDYKAKRNNNREATIENMIQIKDFKKETNKSIYKVPKVKVSKKDREEYVELNSSGQVISHFTEMINSGRNSEGKRLSETEIKKLKWIRTDMQKDEVAVKNELKQYIRFQSITKSEKDHQALSHIQFDNPEIIRLLVEGYSELKQTSYEDTFGYLKIILFAFEELIELTEFKPYMQDILTWKIDGLNYDIMIDSLQDKYGMKMTKPKLSKITREIIPKMVSETYKNMREEWLYTHVMKGDYKTCSSCKNNYLATTKYFSPNNSKTGLRPVCKKCRKEKYQKGSVAKKV